MKLKTLTTAIAITITLISSQNAFATLTPAQAADADYTLYISGSEAFDTIIAESFFDWCTSDRTYYSASVKIPDSAQQAFSCRISNGSIYTVFKRSAGGSGWGVGPVADGTKPIDFLNLSTCPGTTKVTTLPEDAPLPSGDTIYTNCRITGNRHVPNVGISDVEPAMFTGPNLINPLTQENAADGLVPGDPGTVAVDTTGLIIRPINVNTFGIPVTLNLYRALQVAQGLDSTKNDTANMPTLSREQVASIMSGGVSDWGNLRVRTGPETTSRLTELAGVAGVFAPLSRKVEICRGSSGSGIQAQFNALFAGSPCSSLAVTPLKDNTPFTSRVSGRDYPADANNSVSAKWANLGTPMGRPAGAVPAVHEMQSSGDITACLDRLQDQGVWAVGVQSLVAKASTKWRFIKLNGVAPTIENVAKNNYFNWAAATVQYRASGASAPNGVYDNYVVDAILNRASNPVRLSYINNDLQAASQIYLGGSTVLKAPIGFLVPRGTFYETDPSMPSIKAEPSMPFNANNPVMTAVRAVGANPTTCATATMKASLLLGDTELDISTAD